MKAQHAILRFAKYKGPTISRIEAHNERTMDAIPPEIIAIYNAESERKETVHREEKLIFNAPKFSAHSPYD